MISTIMNLLAGSRGKGLRIYVNGVEIDKIEPRLAFLDLDDWMTPLMKYVFEERRDWGADFHVRTDDDPQKKPGTTMREIWFGPVPAGVKKAGYWTTIKDRSSKEP